MQDINRYKIEVKRKIEELINLGYISQAEEVILQFEDIIENDIDIVSMKAIILIMKNELEMAKKLLIKTLNIHGEIFDLIYNLAYVYELDKKYEKAYYYYLKAKELCDDQITKINIDTVLINLKENCKIVEYNNKKRVLVIAHIFPPIGGSGVQRTLKFVKYLKDLNWEPIVVTVGDTVFEYLKDHTLENEIPENIEIFRFDEILNFSGDEIQNLLMNYKKLIKNEIVMKAYINAIDKLVKENNSQEIMNALYIPDTCSLWAMDVLKKIDEYIDFNGIDIIYSTSGPNSDHIIGYLLKEKYNIPWVCDFRDEWTNNPYFDFDKNDLGFNLIYEMEKSILQKANRIITITSLAMQNYINILNVPKEKMITITNGYDDKDFENIELKKEKNDKFTIIHNGMLYMIRTPETFLKAIKKLIEEKKIDKNKIEIIFSYTEHKEKWINYLKDNNMGPIINFKDYMSHEDSIKLAINSDILLLIVGPGEKNKGVYTGKVFEYLKMKKPILALSPKGSIVEDLLKETNSGENFEFDDVDGIGQYILEQYNKWENNQTELLEFNVDKFERKKLTKKLSDVLNEVLILNLKIEKIKNKYTSNVASNNGNKIISSNLEIESSEDDKKIIKEALIYRENDYELLFLLGKIYLHEKKYYEAYKFNEMALNNTSDDLIRSKIQKINKNILCNNILEFQRRNQFKFVIIGKIIDENIIHLLNKIGTIISIINNSLDDINKMDFISLKDMTFDYVVILEKDKEKIENLHKMLKENNIEEKIFDFYSYSYPYFIEGFETKFNDFLKKDKIELLLTGLSYGEVGIDCRKFNTLSFNFALSGQDIFYDYYLTKYLLSFNNLKNNLKHVLVCMGYYAFDYDLSSAEQAMRSHRYYYELGETHHYDNVLHLRLCNALYKCHDYERDYCNYHDYKLNMVIDNINKEQEERVAKKQAEMNYLETRIENKKIFKMYLEMLKGYNISPIIIISPTSRYYTMFYENNYQRDKFYEIMNEFKIEYNFKILDYFDSNLFNDEDFGDYSHLNKMGAEKFTNILNEELNMLIKE